MEDLDSTLNEKGRLENVLEECQNSLKKEKETNLELEFNRKILEDKIENMVK